MPGWIAAARLEEVAGKACCRVLGFRVLGFRV